MINLSVGMVRFNARSISETPDVGLKIKGRVKEDGQAKACLVKLFEQSTGQYLRVIPTDKNGEFVFNHLLASRFFVIAHHPDKEFPAIIQDNVIPK